MADNRASSIPRLLPEILRQITQNLAASSDLLSASLASSILRDEAQRILFRHPSQILFHPRTQYNLSMDQFSAFIDAILLSPNRLGLLVRTYTHQFGDRGSGKPHHLYLVKINKALRAMTNLKRLAFANAPDLPASVLRGCTFQLEAFDWSRDRDIIEIFQDFLPTQPSLKHLTFCYNAEFAAEETISLAASLCPKLESLTGGRDAINLFLKNRNVRYLKWVNKESLAAPKPLDHSFDAELAQVQCFAYIPHNFENPLLPKFLERLQSVVVLETPTKTIEDESNLIVFSKLSSLRILILRILRYRDKIQFETVRDILKRFPRLLHVDVEIHVGKFQRFTQASLASTPMRGDILTEESMRDFHSDSGSERSSQVDYKSHPESYARAFASVSAFDGIPLFPPIVTIDFERDFGQWFPASS